MKYIATISIVASGVNEAAEKITSALEDAEVHILDGPNEVISDEDEEEDEDEEVKG
jgi:hypothetical protein